MSIKKLTFTTKGGDYNSWALDQMLLYVRNGIEQKTTWKYVESIQFADIVIFGWYSGYIENKFLLNKRQIIICLLENDTKKVYPNLFQKGLNHQIDIWLTQSTKEKNKLNKQGFKAFVMPYSQNHNKSSYQNSLFEKDLLEPLINFKLKSNKKLIVSIQRDSSLINNKWVQKEQKNPSYLVNLYKESLKQNIPIMLVITGVRRHWIVNELDKNKLPYIFVGQKPDIKDDYLKKIPRATILEITKECDFGVVTSSWEGGPLCIIESLEVNKLTFSTDVGFSKDLLHNDLILKGNLKKDIEAIKKVINSESKIQDLLDKSIKKYKKFQDLDLSLIIKEIFLLSRGRSRNSLKRYLMNKVFFLDKIFNSIENFTRRLLCFIKKI